MRKLNFLDYVVYLSLLVLTVWLILKITGYIQTPLWLEYGVPVSSIILTLFGVYTNLIKSIGNLTMNLATLNIKFGHMDSKVNKMDNKLDKVYLLKGNKIPLSHQKPKNNYFNLELNKNK